MIEEVFRLYMLYHNPISYFLDLYPYLIIRNLYQGIKQDWIAE